MAKVQVHAIELFQAGKDPVPDVTDHPNHVRTKYGFGLNLEQELTTQLRMFGRGGWNEGLHESIAYTEVDATGALGAEVQGDLWRREGDFAGLAMVVNMISHTHQEYLSLGGLGFILGDGRLSYGPETIFEVYYTMPLPIWRGVFGSVDLQYVINPGYNRDRGPVIVPGLRGHIDF
jgi:hypothetical protein